MPRVARERSSTGIYHIMMRGTNRQEIFYDDEDNIRFLETLARYAETSKMKVYGWCLMENHVHLLLKEGEEDISKTIQRVGISYAWFFNLKYGMVGHLFQDRFRSEKVETDAYLMTVIRYIHQNPVKSGLAKRAEDWRWSSCRGYYGKPCGPAGMLDTELIWGTIDKDQEKAIKQFILFNEQGSDDNCLDDVKKIRLTDKEALEEIRKVAGGHEIIQIRSLEKEKRGKIFKKIKEIEGISLRQAGRILGVSHVLIHNS